MDRFIVRSPRDSPKQLNTLECKADDRDVEIVEEIRIEAKEEKVELNGAGAGEKDDSQRKKRRKSELFNWEPPERTVNKRRSIRLQKNEEEAIARQTTVAESIEQMKEKQTETEREKEERTEKEVEQPMIKKRKPTNKAGKGRLKQKQQLDFAAIDRPTDLKPIMRSNTDKHNNQPNTQTTKSVKFDLKMSVQVVKPRNSNWDKRTCVFDDKDDVETKNRNKTADQIRSSGKPDECRLTFARLDLTPNSHQKVISYLNGKGSKFEDSLSPSPPIIFNCTLLPDEDSWRKREEEKKEEAPEMKGNEIEQNEERLLEVEGGAEEEERLQVEDRFEWMRKLAEREVETTEQLAAVCLQSERADDPFSHPQVREIVENLDEREEVWWKKLLQIREQMQENSSLHRLPWTELLAPATIFEWVGSESQTSRLQKVIESWKAKIKRITDKKNQAKEKTKKKSKRKRAKSESDSDWEDEEEDRLPNPLVLAGPTGSGKSALIRALTRQLNFAKVEVNLSENRSANNVRARLTNAVTQHSVSHHAFFSPTIGFESLEHNLAVVEDVDVRFPAASREESKKRSKEDAKEAPDQGFSKAIIDVTNIAKTPVIWTCQSREAYDEMIVQAERQNTEILFKTELFDLESDEKGVVSYLQLVLLAMGNVLVPLAPLQKAAESVSFDLRCLLNQAQFFAAQPEMPFEWQQLGSEFANDGCGLSLAAEEDAAEMREERKQDILEECENILYNGQIRKISQVSKCYI
ncbi:hypothetical protein WR25_06548 isoform B [Diploscapter pachys]|uniref:ATPase AAA-type core domain-containing protein n=1 Tax=Diploscapter pachys TaxID=2018661 RepID=A0A2A2LWM0_9BILA|nr:hypothetical protein WR25_06548 isoform B [Diploscapter pachys]